MNIYHFLELLKNYECQMKCSKQAEKKILNNPKK